MQTVPPVLLLTQDDFLWQHWRALDIAHWLPARGRTLADLRRWRDQGRSLAVIDADMPGLPAWEAPDWQMLGAMQAIVASVRPSDGEGMQTLLAGARGYCHAYAPAVTWEQVLTTVAGGSVWMGATLVNRLLRQVNMIATSAPRSASQWHHDALSARENAVARLVALGESNQSIAENLGIAERTVKAHKLGINDRLQLALLVHGIKTQADV